MSMTRIIVWFVTAALIVYDVFCVIFGFPTISSTCRTIDKETNGLFLWLLLGIWMHLKFGHRPGV